MNMPPDWTPVETIWCTQCGIHRATPYQPMCPVCVDKAKERKP